MINKLRRASEIAQKHGVVNMLRWCADYMNDLRCERRFAIRTSGNVSKDGLGISDEDANEYVPTSYAHFFRAMRHVPIGGTFVDYGCGSGRIVLSAATLPFERVIGIELSADLIRAAKENLSRSRGRLKCVQVEFIAANAMTWHPPDETTVFYFFNPFMGETLKAVMQNVVESLQRTKREAWIVFGCPYHMDSIMSQIIPPSWQLGQWDILWPPFKDGSTLDPNAKRHRIYQLDSR